MKYNNKQIMSLILSGALVTSVTATTVNATDKGNFKERNSQIIELRDSFNLDGLYTTYIDNKPIYVYLNNNLENKYVEKEEAIRILKKYYNNVYTYSKTVDNPDYIKGVSPLTDKKITVYALSNKTSVSGWTRVYNISNSEKVATSIELGEFLLKKIKLENYKTNMIGFANIDINRDGESELVYIGNNKKNEILDKNEAIKWANSVYNNYYIQSKTIYDNKIKRNVTIYAISEYSYVDGWKRINKNNIPSDEVIATNAEYYEALVNMTNNLNTLTWNTTYIRKPDDNIKYDNTYRYMLKKDALDYAYNNYDTFCILAKAVVNKFTNEKEVLYAFSGTHNIEGWTIIANDFIPKDSNIFLTMQDAYNYEYYIANNNIKTLK